MKLILLIFSLLFVTVSSAQQIKGFVTNSQNQPLEAAYVYNLNSKSHAHSSENGVFVLDANKVGDSLRIGLLGFKNRTIALNDSNFNEKLNIILEEKSFQLDELVITETLNPVSTIARLDLNTSPVNSSQEILRKVLGLIIGQHAGAHRS